MTKSRRLLLDPRHLSIFISRTPQSSGRSSVESRFKLHKAVSFSPAHTTKRFPLSPCASATQSVRPLVSIAETQPQLQPECWLSAALLIVENGLRRRFVCFKLCAHFLDLRCLLIKLRCENLHCLPLLGDDGFLSGHRGFQLLYCLLQLRAGTAHHWRLVPKSAVRQTNSNKSNACGRTLLRRVHIADPSGVVYPSHPRTLSPTQTLPSPVMLLPATITGAVFCSPAVLLNRSPTVGRVEVASRVVIERCPPLAVLLPPVMLFWSA